MVRSVPVVSDAWRKNGRLDLMRSLDVVCPRRWLWIEVGDRREFGDTKHAYPIFGNNFFCQSLPRRLLFFLVTDFSPLKEKK